MLTATVRARRDGRDRGHVRLLDSATPPQGNLVAVHLFMYLALALAFTHEIALGPSFVGHPLTRFVWSVLWASTAGLVLVYRFGLPCSGRSDTASRL